MFYGSMVALVTPMTQTGEIDFTALDRLVDFHLANQTQALVIAGTTGEAGCLTQAEKLLLYKHVTARVRGRIAVIAGTAMNSTQSTIELTEFAKQSGVDGALIMTPAYIKPTQAGLIAHYTAIAKAVALPIILYNVPGRTACDLLPETVIQLAKIANIVGVKEASGDLTRIDGIKQACATSMAIYCGDDGNSCRAIEQGARGVISVTANVAPAEVSAMVRAAMEGDIEQAKALDKPLQDLHQQLFIESNPIPVKYALAEMGLIENYLRLPLMPLSQKHRACIQAAISILKSKVAI